MSVGLIIIRQYSIQYIRSVHFSMGYFGGKLFLKRTCTPQPLYNTIVRVQTNFCVSYPFRVIMKVKCSYIRKLVLYDHLGSSFESCYIQNHVIMNPVIKRLK